MGIDPTMLVLEVSIFQDCSSRHYSQSVSEKGKESVSGPVTRHQLVDSTVCKQAVPTVLQHTSCIYCIELLFSGP